MSTGVDGGRRRRSRSGFHPRGELTAKHARAVERECLKVLTRLRPTAPFHPEVFLSHVAYLAGGPIYTGVMPDPWADLLASSEGGHVSALTLTQYDGWVIYINPHANVPDVLNFGHEAGHILFDAPRGTADPPRDERLMLPEVGSGAAERLLKDSWSRRGGFTGLAESRAERFGTLLKAAIEGLSGQSASPERETSSMFMAGDV